MTVEVVTPWVGFYQTTIEGRIARSDLAEISAVTDRVLGSNGGVYAEDRPRSTKRSPDVYTPEYRASDKRSGALNEKASSKRWAHWKARRRRRRSEHRGGEKEDKKEEERK